MSNIMDYLDWRGDLTFEQSPFNEVDNLILAQLAYTNFDYIVPSVWSELDITLEEAANHYFLKYSEQDIAQLNNITRISIPLFKKMATTDRFKQIRLSNFTNIIDIDNTKQFAAVCYEILDGTNYVAYRGTDSNIIGWKENFNMSIGTTVPAQFEALTYLEQISEKQQGLLRIGGHSKGGNLAVYAAVMTTDAVKSRIIEIYNNDGPGFDERFTKDGRYETILERVKTIVPQFSIVGKLLEHREAYTIVKSNQRLLLQHEAFSWEVLGATFVKAGQVEKTSELVDLTLKSWLNQLSRSQRQQFVSAIFYLFEEADIRTIDDLTQAKWKKLRDMIRVLNQSKENKIVLRKAFKLLFSEGSKHLLTFNREKHENKTK